MRAQPVRPENTDATHMWERFMEKSATVMLFRNDQLESGWYKCGLTRMLTAAWQDSNRSTKERNLTWTANCTRRIQHRLITGRSHWCSTSCRTWTRAAGFGRSDTGRRWPRPTPRCSRCSGKSQSLGTPTPLLQDTGGRYRFSEMSAMQQLQILHHFGSQPTIISINSCFHLEFFLICSLEAF